MVTGVYVDEFFQVYRDRFRIQDLKVISYSGFTDIPVYSFHSVDTYSYGGVLLSDNKLCGFISYSNDKGEGEAIPVAIIDAFLSHAKSKEANQLGFVSQGFRLKDLVDPVLREYYRIPEKIKGAIVKKVLPGTSAWQVLREGDVLVSIEGVPIDSLGLYEHSLWGRQDAQLLLAMDGTRIRTPGQKIELSVFRQAKLQKLNMQLQSYDGKGEKIPEKLIGPSHYLIKNGIVFLELSIPLLRRLYGNKWHRKSSLYNYLVTNKRYYKKSSTDRILVVGTIFPDSATRGIENWVGGAIVSLNGKKIVNLISFHKQLEKLTKQGKSTAKLMLYDKRPLYLDLKNNAAINQRVSQRYSIPKLSSF